MSHTCDCGSDLYFAGYASMGGSHSNYYECTTCGKVYEIWDYNRYPRVLAYTKRIFLNKFSAQDFGIKELLKHADRDQLVTWAREMLWGHNADTIANLYAREFGKEIPLDYGYNPPKPVWIGVGELDYALPELDKRIKKKDRETKEGE